MSLKAKNIHPRREYSSENGSNDLCDRLTIYNEFQQEIAVSDCFSPEDWIELELEGLVFVSPPGYKEEDIMIKWNSLVEFVNPKQKTNEKNTTVTSATT
jgi:hypothetical protein